MSTETITILSIAVPVSIVTTILTGLLQAYVAERRSRLDFRLEFSAENVARRLFTHNPEWRLRSFAVIKCHLGGFSDDELRKILVRSGAIRTYAVVRRRRVEAWGLLENNYDKLGVVRLHGDQSWKPRLVGGEADSTQTVARRHVVRRRKK
jgi:hypothetical protein